MYSISWDEAAMNSGVKSVDDQHKELIRMLNNFVEAATSGKGKEELAKMIGFLGDYTKRHFAHEEQMMALHKCPFAAHNKEEHAKFLADFTNLANHFQKEGPTLAFVMEAQTRVMHWLNTHIRGCDAKLRSCVKAKAA